MSIDVSNVGKVIEKNKGRKKNEKDPADRDGRHHRLRAD